MDLRCIRFHEPAALPERRGRVDDRPGRAFRRIPRVRYIPQVTFPACVALNVDAAGHPPSTIGSR